MIENDAPDGAPGPAATEPDIPRARQKRFLDAFAVRGNVSKAAELAGIHRDSHYRWLNDDPAYAPLFKAAEGQFADAIRDFVKRRAIDGVPEPIIWQGIVVTDKDTGEPVTVLKRSDRILELLAKAKCEEFKEKVEHTGADGGPIQFGKLVVEFVDAPAPGREEA